MSNTTTQTERTIATEVGEGEAWWFLGTRAVRRNPAGAAALPAVIELTVPPGGSPPLHIHDELDDTFFLLDGTLALRCGEEQFVARPGAYVAMPAGVAHTFRVMGNRPARLLLVHADESFWSLIKALGEPAAAPGLPAQNQDMDIDTIEQANRDNDSRIVGPSLGHDEASALLASEAAPPAFTGVDHIAFLVRDLRVSEPWYRTALGLEPEMAEVHDDGTGHIALKHPGTGMVFSLLAPGLDDTGEATTGVEHVALECDGRGELVRWRDDLQARGIDVGTITDAPYGSGFVFRDPDGTELELFTVPEPH